ncbi:MAG TPA: metallophosphoesterase family protein, partial [Terriglobia bacterium]|nr:metallophosphoesterase family protein [Terriglobia bacterium]
MKIGLVSDTHGYLDPRLPELLAGVDSILHAGDVGAQAVLDGLERISGVHGVRGNVDGAELNLPPSLKLRFENLQVEMMHQLSIPQEELERWANGTALHKRNPERRAGFLESFDSETRVVVF